MSLGLACWWTLVRTVLLCLVAWPICLPLERWVRHLPDRKRFAGLALLLAPFLFPELLVGYTYRDLALTSPSIAEGLCWALLLIRLVPLGVITLLAAPADLSSAASLHCRWILLRGRPFAWRELARFLMCLWHGPIRRALPALGLMSLVAFQQFELAALLQTASWTDWFIAAQRVGLERPEMLKQSLWPVMLQLPLLLAIVHWAAREHDRQASTVNETAGRRSTPWPAWVYLGIALLCGCLIPLSLLSWNVYGGMVRLLSQRIQLRGLLQEIVIASAISLLAGMTTWLASRTCLRSIRRRTATRWIRQGILIPGLAGSLLISLATGLLFQTAWLRPFYDTPIPWTLALMIWLLPRAVLVRLWLESVVPGDGVHLAELLNETRKPPDLLLTATSPETAIGTATRSGRARSLLFRLRDQPRILAIGLLCYWSYLDLSTAYLLAPTGMPSGLVRLYNFMHFGRTAALSAEACVFFGVPLTLIVLTIATLRRLR